MLILKMGSMRSICNYNTYYYLFIGPSRVPDGAWQSQIRDDVREHHRRTFDWTLMQRREISEDVSTNRSHQRGVGSNLRTGDAMANNPTNVVDAGKTFDSLKRSKMLIRHFSNLSHMWCIDTMVATVFFK